MTAPSLPWRLGFMGLIEASSAVGLGEYRVGLIARRGAWFWWRSDFGPCRPTGPFPSPEAAQAAADADHAARAGQQLQEANA